MRCTSSAQHVPGDLDEPVLESGTGT